MPLGLPVTVTERKKAAQLSQTNQTHNKMIAIINTYDISRGGK